MMGIVDLLLRLRRQQRKHTRRTRYVRRQRDTADYLLAEPAMRHAYCWRTGRRVYR